MLMSLEPAEGEAFGDGGKLVAGGDAAGETGFEDGADGGDEAGATGEEDAVDGGGSGADGVEEGVDGFSDLGEIWGDPAFEVGAGDEGAEVEGSRFGTAEEELGVVVAGECRFGALDGLVELVAEILVDEGLEGFDLFRLHGALAGGGQDFEHVAGAEEGEVVPAFQIGVDPGGDGREGLVEALGEGVGAEGGGDEVAHHAGVEGVAGEGEAGVAEDSSGGGFGADGDDGEVAGASAEVADEDGFGVVEGLLVGVGGGQGFELEVDVLEAGAEEGGAEAVEGELLVFSGFGADEADGAAYGGAEDGDCRIGFGDLAEVGQDAGDEVFEGVGAAEDLGAGEGADGEVGLEGLDEAAGVVGVRWAAR